MDHSLPGSSVHRDSPGKNAEVDCHALLQDGDLQKGLMSTHTSRNCFCQCPVPTAHNFQPMPPPLETLIMLTGRSDSVSCYITTPFLGPTAHKVLFVPSKSQFSLQSQRQYQRMLELLNNCSFCMLARKCSKSFKLGFSSM